MILPQRTYLELLPVLDNPGTYESRFTPTRAGDYTFHIVGQIGDAAIDEQFTSSPQGFDSVEPASADQFPVAVPAGEELNQRLDALQGGVEEDDLDSVRTLAYIGIATGVIGLLAAAFALLSGRRPAAAASRTEPAPDEPADADDGRLVR